MNALVHVLGECRNAGEAGNINGRIRWQDILVLLGNGLFNPDGRTQTAVAFKVNLAMH